MHKNNSMTTIAGPETTKQRTVIAPIESSDAVGGTMTAFLHQIKSDLLSLTFLCYIPTLSNYRA